MLLWTRSPRIPVDVHLYSSRRPRTTRRGAASTPLTSWATWFSIRTPSLVSRLVENQAHRFASEFLMPRDEIIDDLPRRIDWPTFHDLKRHWGVSLRALVFRAHTLGRLSDASYRRANQQLSIWGIPEPGPLGPAESPQVLGMARKVITDSGYAFDDVMAAGRVAPQVAEEVMEAASGNRPKLRFD